MLSILIVDDECQTIEGLKCFLPWEELGFSSIFTARNSREALDIISKQEIDVLLSDIKMPGESGIDLADKVRILKPDISIVFISAYADKENLLRSITLQVDAFIEKPIELDEVKEVLSKLSNQLLAENSLKKLDMQTIAAEGHSSVEAITAGIKDYIERHFMQPKLSLSDISNELFVSVPYMCSVFKKQTGITIKEYTNDLRINKALHLLKESRLKLNEVAQMVGYANYSYFSKLFKNKTNRNPKDCR